MSQSNHGVRSLASGRRRAAFSAPATAARLPVVALSLALIGLYAPVLARLARNWSVDENYSHGFLIVPIAAYLVWERRARLANIPRRPSSVGLLCVMTSLVVLLVGIFSAEVFLTRISMLGVGAGLVIFLLGWRHLAIVAFPLGFLVLMIPVPAILFNHIALPLQLLASRLGETVLWLAGVPVLREGNVITLAHARLEVAEACSGIRSLVSLLALAVVYGYFTDRRAWARIALAAVAVPVAILVNGLRVAGTGLLAQRFGAQAAEGFFHAFSGWLMFLAAFALIVAIQRLIVAVFPDRAQGGARADGHTSSVEPELASKPGHFPRPEHLGAVCGQDPKSEERVLKPSLRAADPATRPIIATLCLLAAAVAVQAHARPEQTGTRQPLEALPAVIGGWQGRPGPPLDADAVQALGVDDLVNRVYAIDGQPPVALYIGYYGSQREGDTIHSPVNCLPGAGWEPVSRTETEIAVHDTNGAPRSIVVNRLVIEKGADQDLVLYWYQSHGRVVASEYQGRLLMALDAIRLNRTDGGLVRVIAPLTRTDASSRTAGERSATTFVQALFPLLGRYLPQ